jgi:probable rRNA maturation factor
MREISIANRHPRLRLDRRAVARVIHTLDAHLPDLGLTPAQVPQGELSLAFFTDAALAQLHADFLSDPTITDVITFAGDPTFGTAGEICVSVDAALRQLTARPPLRSQISNLKSSTTAPAFSRELTLYLVHGWLHLAGFDDLVPAKKRAMRRAETRALRVLARARALPTFTLRPAASRSSTTRPPRANVRANS